MRLRKVDILAILAAANCHINFQRRVVRAIRLDYHCKNDCHVTLGDFIKPVLSSFNDRSYVLLLTPTEVIAALEVCSGLQLQVWARHVVGAIGGRVGILALNCADLDSHKSLLISYLLDGLLLNVLADDVTWWIARENTSLGCEGSVSSKVCEATHTRELTLLILDPPSQSFIEVMSLFKNLVYLGDHPLVFLGHFDSSFHTCDFLENFGLDLFSVHHQAISVAGVT